jgi:pyruvate kinase
MSQRRAKIVCTIGPASSSRAGLEGLMRAGMNVARLNFSHGEHDEYARIIADLRELAEYTNLPLAILQDLQGPKLRLGSVANDQIHLERGRMITLTTRPIVGDADHVSFPHKEIVSQLRGGDQILVSDGLIRLEARRVGADEIECEVVDGGQLRSRAGINLPGTPLGLPALTAKDRRDLDFGIEQGVDWVALSFVRNAADIAALRAILEARPAAIGVVEKLEKPEAVEALDEILSAADAVMIARGDLGVEISPERVPFVQKRILRRAAEMRVPVITATQMLESMVENPRPTRAEASDVANAIVDRTDALMLSSETSIGDHPVGAVSIMDRIVREAEKGLFEDGLEIRGGAVNECSSFPDAMAEAACNAAHQTDARAIVAFTESGFTALLIFKYRPSVPIYAVTPSLPVFRRLGLFWGVEPRLLSYTRSAPEMIAQADQMLMKEGLVQRGDRLVVLAGMPSGRPGTTNLLKLHRAGETVTDDQKP